MKFLASVIGAGLMGAALASWGGGRSAPVSTDKASYSVKGETLKSTRQGSRDS